MFAKNTGAAPLAWMDSFGATVSIVCAVQCAAFPLLIVTLPFSALAGVSRFFSPGFLLGGGVERVLLVAAVALALGSFIWGYRVHRQFHVLLLLLSALGLIFVGRVWADSWYQIPFVVSGTLLLAAGHLLNRRLCRLCAVCSVAQTKAASLANG